MGTRVNAVVTSEDTNSNDVYLRLPRGQLGHLSAHVDPKPHQYTKGRTIAVVANQVNAGYVRCATPELWDRVMAGRR